MTWTRQPAGWHDAECVTALVGMGAWALAIAMLRLLANGAPRCLLKTLTGVPCLACGGTRAWKALLAGRVADAFCLQPLLTLLAFAAMLWAVYAVAGPLLRLPRVRVQTTRGEKCLLVAGAACLALANWAYLLAAGV